MLRAFGPGFWHLGLMQSKVLNFALRGPGFCSKVRTRGLQALGHSAVHGTSNMMGQTMTNPKPEPFNSLLKPKRRIPNTVY